MQVRVLLFGILQDIAGLRQESLELPVNAKVADVLEHYRAQSPRFEPYLASLATSLNQSFASRDTALNDGDEVGLLPPVSGGNRSTSVSPSETPVQPRARLTREVIDPQPILSSIKQPSDGAVTVFDGIVRDNSRGRRTLFLDYEAYEAMALLEMEKLIEEALRRFPIREARIVHRLGRLEIGESSVLIAVASAHRAAAFDACRWIIDTLKRTVPIWKKEHFEDGAVWADGEPFPPAIAGGTGE
jgi:molybdopterin synthase catalytic subunit/molybdopterin converting factor small subunit